MRVLIASVMLALPLSAYAEPCQPANPAFANVPGEVNVTLKVGKTLKATVVCADRDTLVLVDGARIRQVPLADVLRVVKPRDSLLNGFLIGAAIGALLSSAEIGEGRYAPGSDQDKVTLTAVLILGGIGAGFDALRGSSWNVYTSPSQTIASPSIRWRTRF